MEYGVTVFDFNGVPVTSFNADTESAMVSELSCCTEYAYRVVARTRAGEGMASQRTRFRTSSQIDGRTRLCSQCFLFS